jgi:hypothetical protein
MRPKGNAKGLEMQRRIAARMPLPYESLETWPAKDFSLTPFLETIVDCAGRARTPRQSLPLATGR